jgi:PhnB protein
MTVRGAARAIEFCKQAFGAEEKGAMKGPDGKITHAELCIGDSLIIR